MLVICHKPSKWYRACLDEIHKETKRIADTLADFANELKYQPVVKLHMDYGLIQLKMVLIFDLDYKTKNGLAQQR